MEGSTGINLKRGYVGGAPNLLSRYIPSMFWMCLPLVTVNSGKAALMYTDWCRRERPEANMHPGLRRFVRITWNCCNLHVCSRSSFHVAFLINLLTFPCSCLCQMTFCTEIHRWFHSNVRIVKRNWSQAGKVLLYVSLSTWYGRSQTDLVNVGLNLRGSCSPWEIWGKYLSARARRFLFTPISCTFWPRTLKLSYSRI